MDGTYEILRGGEPVGQARVEKQGLYYRFSCRCDLSGEVIYRITVSCGEKCESLGVPVPEGGDFVLNTRIPVSKLGAGEPVFRAVPRHPESGGTFIPISPETPFPYLRRLGEAFLEVRNGQPGIVLPE